MTNLSFITFNRVIFFSKVDHDAGTTLVFQEAFFSG